ncbi:MAG: prolyl oligopeptidase family serine peptidase, partial [Polyangiaceae bacterium]|nr:prolyl oligopeptidase family serine peptidase [Polyangiaceae bacterium]
AARRARDRSGHDASRGRREAAMALVRLVAVGLALVGCQSLAGLTDRSEGSGGSGHGGQKQAMAAGAPSEGGAATVSEAGGDAGGQSGRVERPTGGDSSVRSEAGASGQQRDPVIAGTGSGLGGSEAGGQGTVPGGGAGASGVAMGGATGGLGASDAAGGAALAGGAAPAAGGSTGGPAPVGGAASGGAPPLGGAPELGGTASGGVPPRGGAPPLGGSVSGGAPSGGSCTGGVSAAGGLASGGGASGGTGGVSFGCGSDYVTSPCDVSGSMCSLSVNGVMRTYHLQLPPGYISSKPYPVIFQFHPWGGTADQALTMYQLNSKIPDAIYVTPQGLVASGSSAAGWANTDGEDIDFVRAMLDVVRLSYCVDNARIFATGFSYGGMMSFAIGCEMSDVFRAIAPMSGALYSDFNCTGTGPPIALWGSHGLSDDVVPLEDGQAALQKILQRNHCGTATTSVDPSPCVKYLGCDAGYDVTWCEWDAEHAIPSFGSSAIADFFLQF